MLQFPEIFGGAPSFNLPFATGTTDQTPAANAVTELWNGTTNFLATLTGITVWANNTATANFSIYKAKTATDVSGAATIGPVWMDQRRNDLPTHTLAQGNLASLGTFTELQRWPLPGFAATAQLYPWLIPVNWDIPPGSGLLFVYVGAIRTVVSPIWIERTQSA